MLLTRKIGSVLRGKATPFQVLAATTLGCLLGFVPGFFLPGDLGGGFLQAPGLILALLGLALVLNANLAVFGLVTLLAKTLSLLLLPISYRLGIWLLDGPLQGLFRGLVNGKVTAWFGLEHYATTGGLLLGLLFGIGGGILLNRSIRALRLRMAEFEENSERFRHYAGKWWVRLLSWLLLGKGKGKKSWQELTGRRVGQPIRIWGAALVVVLVGSIWVFQQWFSTPILTHNLRTGLEKMNGATVDLDAARLDLSGGSLRIEKLAIADRQQLDQDLLAADELVATLDTGELLRKRFVIDELRSTTARAGTPRAVPGERLPDVEPPPEPPPPPAGTRTIEDYLAEFERWKQRLEQAQQWLEVLTGEGEEPPADQTPEQRAEERAEQERIHGIASVVAHHLLEQGPRVLIRKIDIEGIGYSIGGKEDTLDLRLRNVADQPSLVRDAISLRVAARSDAMLLAASRGAAGQPDLGFEFALRGLPVDGLIGQLRIGGSPPLRGGTIDFATDGKVQRTPGEPASLALPLELTLHDTVFALAGANETKVDRLVLPVGLQGPMTRPTVVLDDATLQQALLDAGKKELADFVASKAGELLGPLPEGVRGALDPDKSPQQHLEDAQRKAEEEVRRLEEEAKKKAAEEALKRLPGIRLPGKKEDGR